LIRCAERHGHPPQRGGSTFPFGEGVSPNGLTDEVIPNPSAILITVSNLMLVYFSLIMFAIACFVRPDFTLRAYGVILFLINKLLILSVTAFCKFIVYLLLRGKYVNLKRVFYTCGSESCVLECERERWEKTYSNFFKQKVNLLCVDEEVEHKSKYYAGKAGYIERNKAMIDDSNYCIFYYDEKYLLPERKRSKRSFLTYQPKSGTKLAYDYANSSNKITINVIDYVN
jgi:hypothetical protein